MNVIFGTAGFAREVDWLTEDLYSDNGVDYRAHFFVAEDGNPFIGDFINSRKVISESEFFSLSTASECVNCIVAVGKPELKEKIVNKVKLKAVGCKFPNIIHPNVSYDVRAHKVRLGIGNIICSKTVLTTDISLGNFVHLNLACTIGHDSAIGDFSTLSPGVHVSGNVRLAERVFVGTGAVIIEKINVCEDVVVGAGSVVTKDLSLPGTYVGMPVRKIR